MYVYIRNVCVCVCVVVFQFAEKCVFIVQVLPQTKAHTCVQ